jgi:hypothetical protein
MNDRSKRVTAGSHSGRNEENMSLFNVGDVVQAKFQGGKKYYTGIIVKERCEGTYHILYTDGEEEAKRRHCDHEVPSFIY